MEQKDILEKYPAEFLCNIKSKMYQEKIDGKLSKNMINAYPKIKDILNEYERNPDIKNDIPFDMGFVENYISRMKYMEPEFKDLEKTKERAQKLLKELPTSWQDKKQKSKILLANIVIIFGSSGIVGSVAVEDKGVFISAFPQNLQGRCESKDVRISLEIAAAIVRQYIVNRFNFSEKLILNILENCDFRLEQSVISKFSQIKGESLSFSFSVLLFAYALRNLVKEKKIKVYNKGVTQPLASQEINLPDSCIMTGAFVGKNGSNSEEKAKTVSNLSQKIKSVEEFNKNHSNFFKHFFYPEKNEFSCVDNSLKGITISSFSDLVLHLFDSRYEIVKVYRKNFTKNMIIFVLLIIVIGLILTSHNPQKIHDEKFIRKIIQKSAAENNGCETWNEWRRLNIDMKRNEQIKIELRNIDLKRMNLSGINLEDARLDSANLSGSNLTRAKLKRAILINACLINSGLSNTNLFQADLSNTNMKGANLEGANMKEANLKNVKNLTPNQISKCANINGIKGLSKKFLEELKKIIDKTKKPNFKLPNDSNNKVSVFVSELNSGNILEINDAGVITVFTSNLQNKNKIEIDNKGSFTKKSIYIKKPGPIKFDKYKNLFVLDISVPQLVEITPVGKISIFTKEIPQDGLVDLAIADDGTVFLLTIAQEPKFGESTARVWELIADGAPVLLATTEHEAPIGQSARGFTFGPGGHLYLAMQGGNGGGRILRITRAGQVSTFLSPGIVPFNKGGGSMLDIRFNSQEEMLILGHVPPGNSRIIWKARSGILSTFVEPGKISSGALQLAIDHKDNLFVSGGGFGGGNPDGMIQRIDPFGNITTLVTFPGLGPIVDIDDNNFD